MNGKQNAPGQANKTADVITIEPGTVIIPDAIGYIVNPSGAMQQQQNYDLPAGTYRKESSTNGRDWLPRSLIDADGQTSYGVGIPFALNTAWRIVKA